MMSAIFGSFLVPSSQLCLRLMKARKGQKDCWLFLRRGNAAKKKMEKNWRHYLPFEDLGLRAPKRKNNDSVLYSRQEAVVKVVSEEISFFGDLVLLAPKKAMILFFLQVRMQFSKLFQIFYSNLLANSQKHCQHPQYSVVMAGSKYELSIGFIFKRK